MTGPRQHPRYAIELDAELTVEGQPTITGRTRDISKGGFCMLAREAIAVGIACQVRLKLVFEEGQFSEHLDVAATVVWCTPIQGVKQIGLKFAPLTPQTRGYLELFMHFLDGGGGEED